MGLQQLYNIMIFKYVVQLWSRCLEFHDMVYIDISAGAEKLVKNYLTMISFKNLLKNYYPLQLLQSTLQ